MTSRKHLSAASSLMSAFAFAPADEEDAIEHLSNQIERQNLIIQTLLALLLERGLFSASDFNKMAEDLDTLDGERDYRLSDDRVTAPCPHCGLSIKRATSTCPHCGREVPPQLIATRKPHQPK